MAIKFNGQSLPSYVKVRNVQVGLLPPVSQKVVEIPGRAGSYDFGNQLGSREIKVDFIIKASSPSDLRTKARDFAKWLYTEEPAQLVILDEPDKCYMAKVTGDTDLQETLRLGEGTVTFYCADPFAYGIEKSRLVTSSGYAVTEVLVFPDILTDSNNDGALDGWTRNYPSTFDTIFAVDTEKNAQMIRVTSSPGTGYATVYIDYIPVTPGNWYVFTADHLAQNVISGFRYNLVIDWRDSSYNVIYYGNSTYYSSDMEDWDTIYYRAQAPANATQVRLKLQVNIQTAGGMGTVWFKNVGFYKEQAATIDDVPTQVVNNGGIETPPVIEVEFTSYTTEFEVSNGDERLYFGEPDIVDSGKTSAPKRLTLISDACTSVAPWTSGVGVEGGIITGTFESIESTFRQAGVDYGQGSQWHGAARVRSLGQAIQDFTVQMAFYFRVTNKKQIGRIEMYLLDVNNAIIGKMAIKDAQASVASGKLEARAGDYNGHYFVNTEVGRGSYTNFYGMMTISRKGKWWYFEIGKYNSKGQLYGRWSSKWYDKYGQYQQKLAAIQLHFAQYGSYDVPEMRVEWVGVYQENYYQPATQVPYVFETGDKLLIDCEKGLILKNGEPFFEGIGDIGSTFFKLKPGVNQIYMAPAISTYGKITFKERWL